MGSEEVLFTFVGELEASADYFSFISTLVLR